MTCGFVFVAVGDKAQAQVRLAVEQLRLYHPAASVRVLGRADTHQGGVTRPLWRNTSVQMSRWLKVNLYDLSPFELTCYLDADTRAYSRLDVGFAILRDGWDLAIAPSTNQGRDDAFWHVMEQERDDTFRFLGRVPVQLQGGVFFFARNERVRAFFFEWKRQWALYKNQDQAALVRALECAPVRVWLMGRPWNGGAVIGHKFGACRR